MFSSDNEASSVLSNTYANGLHLSELSTKILELSRLVYCARGFYHIIQLPGNHKEATTLPAAGTTDFDCSVLQASKAMTADIPSFWGKVFTVQDMFSQHVISLAASPQTPSVGVWALHNLPPALIWTNSFHHNVLPGCGSKRVVWVMSREKGS